MLQKLVAAVSREDEKKAETRELAEIVKEDIKAADLKVSLYIAACNTLAADQIRPAPPGPYETVKGRFDFTVNDRIPSVELLLRPHKLKLSEDTKDVLRWLLVRLREPKIITVMPEYYQKILELVSDEEPVTLPTFAFRLSHDRMSVFRLNWLNKTYGCTTNFAYFPCNAATVHNVLYSGAFTEPSKDIILYTNLGYCLSISQPAWTWGKSSIGSKLSIVCIVEFANAPGACEVDSDTEVDSVSHRVYRILDPTAARLKYLLVFVHQIPESAFAVPRKNTSTSLKIHAAISFLIITIIFLSLRQPSPPTNSTV